LIIKNIYKDIFNGKNTKDARKTCPKNFWKVAVRKLDFNKPAVLNKDIFISKK